MPEPVYTLHRLVWRRHADGWLNLPGSDPVRTYSDRAIAEAAAGEMEWDIRGRINPFRCGGPRLHYQTAFDAARLFDWCLDHSLDPPGVTPESATWSAWWDDHQKAFTPAQRAAVWEVLDRVRFFRVEESGMSASMHLVALPHFESDPIPSYGPERYVGCTPYMLVRRTDTADGLCHELYIDRLALVGEFGNVPAGDPSWRVPEPDPFETIKQEFASYGPDPTYFPEHRPLGLTSARPPIPGREVFVVLRRGWRIEEGGESGSWRWSPTHAKSCGRPVVAFGTQAAADAHMAKLEAEARSYASPYRFGTHLEWGTTPASWAWGTLSELSPIDFTNLWTDYTGTDRLWYEWWDAAVPNLTADQVETAWGLFENLRFYEVVAVEFRE